MTSDTKITLNELARQLKMNKSHLHYWVKRGLITPESIIGRAFLFPKVESKRLVRRIAVMRKKGYSIDLIKEKLKIKTTRRKKK